MAAILPHPPSWQFLPWDMGCWEQRRSVTARPLWGRGRLQRPGAMGYWARWAYWSGLAAFVG